MSSRGRARETSLPYVPVDPHWETHRRTEALIDALADHTELPETLLTIIPVRIWTRAGQSAIDGNLGAISPRALRRFAAPEFGIPSDVLFAALTDQSNGFLQVDDDGCLHVHDWGDYGGRLAAQRAAWREAKKPKDEQALSKAEKARERKRRSRQRSRNVTPDVTLNVTPESVTCAGHACDIAEMSHPETDTLSNDSNGFDFSRGKLAESFENSVPKGKRKVKDKTPPPHSTAVDSSAGDAPTAESVGGDGDGLDFGEGGVGLVGRGETEANPGVDIPTVEAATEAVELLEAELAQQPSAAHSEPTHAQESHPVEGTPQEPEETTTEAAARAMVAALGVTIPAAPIDDKEQSHNGCSVVERKWAVGRDLDDLPDHEALTTLDVDKALRSAGYIRGAMGTHAWGKLGKLHDASPLTAGELRSALRLAQGPKVGAHLPYMAGCVERRRQGLVAPPSTRPQSPTSVTVPRKVEAIHEYHERCKQAHLREQMDAGLPPDEERADRAAFSGMPTDEDRERYHGANGRWENIDDRAAKAMAECMASVMAH